LSHERRFEVGFVVGFSYVMKDGFVLIFGGKGGERELEVVIFGLGHYLGKSVSRFIANVALVGWDPIEMNWRELTKHVVKEDVGRGIGRSCRGFDSI
jgi:hypothetical protein